MNDIIFEFNPDKNKQLIAVRGISFEEIITALMTNKLLDIVDHLNQAKYPNEKCMYLS